MSRHFSRSCYLLLIFGPGFKVLVIKTLLEEKADEYQYFDDDVCSLLSGGTLCIPIFRGKYAST